MILIEANYLDSPPKAVIEVTKGELLFWREALDAYGADAAKDGQLDISGAASLGSAQIDEILWKLDYLEKST